jgi:hypothetical protein
MRCPSCSAVGTYNLHRPSLDVKTDTLRPYRWMCKYCGFYRAKGEGEGRLVYPSAKHRVWCFISEADGNGEEPITPLMVMEKHLSHCWPWKR